MQKVEVPHPAPPRESDGEASLRAEQSRLHTIAEDFGRAMKHEDAMEPLAASEELQRAALEDTPALACCFRTTGEVTYVNRAYCRYFQKTREELVGSAFLPSIPDVDRQTIMARVASLTVGVPTWVHDQQTIGEAGKVRWQRWTLHARFDRSGMLTGFQAHGEDTTESGVARENGPR